MEPVTIVKGLRMPFFPMRPTAGQDIRTKADVSKLWSLMRNKALWVVQPKLNEHRRVLAMVDGQLLVQNRHAQWVDLPDNAAKWRKLPDRTVLDGGLYRGNFVPFEALTLWGRSLLGATTAERVVIAYQMCRLCGVKWMFESPERVWLEARTANLPMYEGVVLKHAASPYLPAGNATQVSAFWFKRRWA